MFELILMLLLTIYIMLPVVLTSFLFGGFLINPGSMKFCDLRNLLGLFFETIVLWIFADRTLCGSLQTIQGGLFSKSGHYIVAQGIRSFGLVLVANILQLLTDLYESRRIPSVDEHFITTAFCHAYQNIQEEFYYYVEKIDGVSPRNTAHPGPCHL